MSTQLRFSDGFAEKLEEALKKLLEEEGEQLTCEVWGSSGRLAGQPEVLLYLKRREGVAGAGNGQRA